MSVIDLALVVIVENLICLLNGLELNFGSWTFIFGDFVGVAGEGGLDESAVSRYIFK